MKRFTPIIVVLALVGYLAYADTTSYVQLPVMQGNTIDSYITYNTTAKTLDILLYPVLTTYPASATAELNSATNGDLFIVPTDGDGAWSGKDTQLAFYFNNGWSFSVPRTGWIVYDATAAGSEVIPIVYNGTSWDTVNNVIESFHLQESEPADPAEAEAIIWAATGGDLKYKVKYNGTVKSATVVDYSAL